MSVWVEPNQILQLAKWVTPDKAKDIADAINACLDDGRINTPERLAQFMAQVAHETFGFRHFTESFFYNDPLHLVQTFPHRITSIPDARALMAKGPEAIANRVYANRFGNGDEASGDGWRYRGRGFIQITFKANYEQVGKQIGMDLVGHPEALEELKAGADSAAKFWNYHACNQFADTGDQDQITYRINPAMAGQDDRRVWLEKCQKIWK